MLGPRPLAGHRKLRRHARARRGTIYIAVLGVGLIVSLIAMASLHLGRLETDVLTGAGHIAHAELLSHSAVEFALARINASATWRTDHVNNPAEPTSWMSMGSGFIKYKLVDADGSLTDDSRDTVTLRGFGMAGEAIQATSVELEPASTALGCLEVAMHIGGNVTVSGSTTVTVDRTVSSNSNINVSSGAIQGDAWAVGTISGSVSGTSTPLSASRTMPNSAEMWKYYLANGTYINIASIPSQTIDRVVLSAASNPYGAENPQGIYIINTGGQTLRIRDSRIEATLVVISPGATTEVEGCINWAPAGVNFPALLVDGNLAMEWSGGGSLVESAAGVNFNPAGTPYDTPANFDADTTDSYPGIIKGVVFCSGNLSVTSACVMQGSLVAAGTASVSAPVTIAYDGRPAAYPPPGFASGATMRVIPRSWTRTTAP
jgi:hypothetical protein